MIQNILTIAFVAAGLFFLVVSIIGTVRFPDFYCKLQVLGVGQTLAVLLMSIGLVIYQGFNILSLKIIIIFIAILVGGPIGTHIVDKVAFKEAMEDREEKKEGK